MEEQFRLIRAAEAYIEACLATLQKESAETHEKVSEKLQIGRGKITLVIAQYETDWRCTVMMRERAADTFGIETVQLCSCKVPIHHDTGSPGQEESVRPERSEAPTPPSLSLEEFFHELERVRELFQWRLQADIYPRDRRASPRFWICGSPRDEEGVRLGPVELVCYAVTGAHEEWARAAERIGLSNADASSISAAAADRTWKGPHGSRKPDEFLIALRERILEAIGIRMKPQAFDVVSAGKADQIGSHLENPNPHESFKDLLHDADPKFQNRLAMKDPRR